MDSGQVAFLLPVRPHIGDKEDEVVDRPRKSVDGGKDVDDEENEKNYFTIYTPNKVLKYRIASAGVYSNASILYYYDFDEEEEFNAFFDEFNNFSYGSRNISQTFTPKFGDKLVILLTCHKRNNNYRYITIGVLVEELPGRLVEKEKS